jgi:hypothetical protein
MSMVTYFVLALSALFVPYLVRMAFDMLQGRSAREIRSQRRGDDSEYDGHHDYLEDVETPKARFLHWLTLPVDTVVSFLGGLTIARWLGAPSPADIGGGPLGVPFLLYSLFVLMLATGLVYAIVMRVNEGKGRLYSYPVVLALFFFGFLAPVERNRAVSSQAAVERADAINAFETRADEVRAKWRADLQAAGAYGAPGAEPPMLVVRKESDGRLIMTNLSGKRIEMIRVARVVRDSTRMDGWARCYLEAKSNRSEWSYIAKDGVQEFVLPERRAAETCASGELEFRIGDEQRPEPSWWTDSALVGYDQASEEISKRTEAMARSRAQTSGRGQ